MYTLTIFDTSIVEICVSRTPYGLCEKVIIKTINIFGADLVVRSLVHHLAHRCGYSDYDILLVPPSRL